MVARELAGSKRHDAIICLGAVIRGDTPHFDYVAGEAVKGIGHVAAALGLLVAIHFSSSVSVVLDKCLAQTQIHDMRALG